MVEDPRSAWPIRRPGVRAPPASALGTLIVLNVWTVGSSMVIFLAGLRQIPPMYYEGACSTPR